MHSELDGRTLDIVHCFYDIALIKLQILQMHVHVLFPTAALFATRARAHVVSQAALFATRALARVVFTGSIFALLISRRFRCFCNHFGHVF